MSQQRTTYPARVLGTRPRFRVFETFDHSTGDPRRWIAATDDELARAAAQRRGWEGFTEVQPTPHVPQDDKGLRQMGVDLIVRRK